MRNYIKDLIVNNFTEKVSELETVKVTDIAYYYEAEENWFYIVHNFAERIHFDDDFAKLVGDLMYEYLIDEGIRNFSFYEDEQELSSLTSVTDRAESQNQVSFNFSNETSSFSSYELFEFNEDFSNRTMREQSRGLNLTDIDMSVVNAGVA